MKSFKDWIDLKEMDFISGKTEPIRNIPNYAPLVDDNPTVMISAKNSGIFELTREYIKLLNLKIKKANEFYQLISDRNNANYANQINSTIKDYNSLENYIKQHFTQR